MKKGADKSKEIQSYNIVLDTVMLWGEGKLYGIEED